MRKLFLGVVLTAVAAGCAARATMPPAPAVLRYPEFRYPVVPGATDEDQATRIERGWRYLQSDNQRNAQREFEAALERQPSFYPAAAGLGYVQLARRDHGEAVSHFNRALDLAPRYAPALVGRGQALLALDRDGEALESYEAALAADPSLVDLESRIQVLRFRTLQNSLARAKAASEAGRWTEARDAYQRALAASPDSAFLYRELALVERRAGEPSRALEHFRRAVALDPSDARSHVEIGAILEEGGDLAGAIAAFEKARAIEPSAVPEERLTALREAVVVASLPAEYRAIPSAASASRAELAAVVGIRLRPLLERVQPRQTVITDVRNHWAQPWITQVVRAGVMDIQPNYTFQPAGRVRRGELAQVVSRVLNLIAAVRPLAARAWQGSRQKIADVPPGHLSHPAVSAAVASGVLPLDPDGTFQLLRPVTGAELVEAIARLETLAR